MSSYHDTKTQTQRRRKKGIAVRNLELVVTGQLAYEDIDTDDT